MKQEVITRETVSDHLNYHMYAGWFGNKIAYDTEDILLFTDPSGAVYETEISRINTYILVKDFMVILTDEGIWVEGYCKIEIDVEGKIRPCNCDDCDDCEMILCGYEVGAPHKRITVEGEFVIPIEGIEWGAPSLIVYDNSDKGMTIYEFAPFGRKIDI